MLPTDSRTRWAWTGGVLTDQRVAHFWDEQKVVGRWFAAHDPESADSGVVWDAYYLYGPDAHWANSPEPLLSTGATVRAELDELKNKLQPLL